VRVKERFHPLSPKCAVQHGNTQAAGYLVVWSRAPIISDQASLFNYHKGKGWQFRLPIIVAA